MEPIDFELRDFTTGIDGGRFTFAGASKLGERIEWHGHLTAQPIESDGEFRIEGLQAHTIWSYLEDRLNFAVNTGSIDVSAAYKFSLRDAVDLTVDVSKVAVTGLTVRPKDSDIDWITLPSLDASGTTVDLAKHEAHADSLTLTGLKLMTWLEPDGSLNLLKLAQTPAASGSHPAAALPTVTTTTTAVTAGPTAATTTTTVTTATTTAAATTTTAATTTAAATAGAPATAPATSGAPAATMPWRFDLREFALTDASISAEDRATRPAAKVLLAPFSVKVAGASLDLSKAVTVTLDTRIDGSGSLNVSGNVTPQPLSADLAVKMDGIDLKAAQPYIGQRTSMTLLGGRLSGDAKVHYGASKPSIRLAGNISVAKLHTIDNALHEDLVNWERLDLQGVAFQHEPDRLDIDQVVVRRPYARVIIEPDTSLNVTRVLAAPGATLVVPKADREVPVVSVTAAAPPASPRVKRARKQAGKALSSPPAPAAAQQLPMSIKKIALYAGEADFADLSVMPNFAAGIKKLEGTILGLSSKPNSRAKVDIRGAVDEFSPVAIKGEVNMSSASLYTDLALSFRNMELSTFNPYSGKFAGYNITKGKLTTEFHYKVEGRKLDAQHHITIDQLEFGRQDREQGSGVPAHQTSGGAAQGPAWGHRPGYSRERHPRRSLVSARPHHLEGVRQHPGEGRDRAVRAVGLLVRRRSGFAIHRFRTGRGCARCRGARRKSGRWSRH